MKLFVEGGGDSNALKSACREGFTKFITAAGITVRPRIVACGSRKSAFDSYRIAIQSGDAAMLLVDSEDAVAPHCEQGDTEQWTPWMHLRSRQGDLWKKPENAEEKHCHLMVECMESWLLADAETLAKFFGQGFLRNALPAAGRPVEKIRKNEVYDALKRATKPSKKGEYGKGDHSFKLLSEINPQKVISASPWAARFINQLKSAMQG